MILVRTILILVVFGAVLYSFAFWLAGVPQTELWGLSRKRGDFQRYDLGPFRLAAGLVKRLHPRLVGINSARFLSLIAFSGCFSVALDAVAVTNRETSTIIAATLLHLSLAVVVAAYIRTIARVAVPHRTELSPELARRANEVVSTLLDQNKFDYAMLLLAGLPSIVAAQYLERYLKSQLLPEEDRATLERYLLSIENDPEFRYSVSHVTSRLYCLLEAARPVAGPVFSRDTLDSFIGIENAAIVLHRKLRARDLGNRVLAALYWTTIAPSYGVVLALHRWATRDITGRSQFFSTLRLGQFGQPFAYYRLHRATTADPKRSLLHRSTARLLDSVNFQTPAILNVIAGKMNLLGPLPIFRVQYEYLDRQCRDHLEIISAKCAPHARVYQRLLIKPGLVSTAMIDSIARSIARYHESAPTKCCDFAQADIACVKRVLTDPPIKVFAGDVGLLFKAFVISLRFSIFHLRASIFGLPDKLAQLLATLLIQLDEVTNAERHLSPLTHLDALPAYRTLTGPERLVVGNQMAAHSHL